MSKNGKRYKDAACKLDRYRREPGDPDPAPDTVRAIFQFQMLPDEVEETP